MSVSPFVGLGIGAVCLAGVALFVSREVNASVDRLTNPAAKEPVKVAVADHTEAPYCTPQFKTVLQRVLNACGLVGQESRRGCQPADVKTFASISDDDFNALFTPLSERGAILMFDDGKELLDDGGKKLLQEKWEDRRGARYFFIVARALPQARQLGAVLPARDHTRSRPREAGRHVVARQRIRPAAHRVLRQMEELARRQEMRQRGGQPQRVRLLGRLPFVSRSAAGIGARTAETAAGQIIEIMRDFEQTWPRP
jgi:hypothetical protein